MWGKTKAIVAVPGINVGAKFDRDTADWSVNHDLLIDHDDGDPPLTPFSLSLFLPSRPPCQLVTSAFRTMAQMMS